MQKNRFLRHVWITSCKLMFKRLYWYLSPLKSASLESDYDQAPTCCESTGFPSSIDYFIVPWRSDDIRLHDLSPCSVLGPCWFLCVSGISFTTRWVRGRGRREISALTASPGLSTSSRWRFPGIRKNALFRRWRKTLSYMPRLR